MRFFGLLPDALVGSVIVTLLAGCSGVGNLSSFNGSPAIDQPQSLRRSQQSQGLTAVSHSFADSDAAATGAVIVSGGDVYVYTEIGKLTARITGITYPTGLALDTAGNLYVANGREGSPGILVYKNDYKTLIATLSDPYPSLGVAVDSSTGVVAASNVDPNNVANVTFYAKGASTPCTDVIDNNLLISYQGAFDKAGNLYVTAEDLNFNQVVGVISGGCSAQAVTLLSTGNTLSGNIFGIGVTATGKIAVGDQGNRAIYTYNPPINGALGVPTAITPLMSITDPKQFAFTKNGAHMFVTDGGQIQTYKYAYPAGGNALKYIAPQDSPIGVVTTSAAK